MQWKISAGLSVCMLIGSSPALSATVVVSEATIPVEVLPLDPALAKGELFGAKVRYTGMPSIGLQPARVHRGIVREDGKGKDPFTRVLALALLNGAHRNAESAKQDWANVPSGDKAWCELIADYRSFTNCFQDLDGDGRLESKRDGYAMHDEALALAAVSPVQPMTPVAYHPAQTDELPLLQVGYLSCRFDAQFATAVRRVIKGKGKSSPLFGGCRHDARPIDGQAGVLQIDRFKVAVAEAEGISRTEIVEGMSPGTILGSVRSDRPLLDLAQIKSLAASREAASGNQPYLYFTATPKVAEGDIGPGAEIIGGDVAHGLVGRLQEPLRIFGAFGMRSPDIPAGTKVYGVPMSSKGGAKELELNTVWCLPTLDGRTWDTDCFGDTSFGSVLAMGLGTPFAIEATHATESDRHTGFPRIERIESDLGIPLRLSVTLKKWNRNDVALMLAVSPNDNNTAAPREQRYRRAEDGSVTLRFGPGRLQLSPSKTVQGGVHVEVLQAPQTGYSALPGGIRERG
jgi:hypothetical protein